MVAVVSARSGARDFKWEELQKQGRVLAGTVLPPEPGSSFSRLRIEHGGLQQTPVTVLTIDRPQIESARYVLKGEVRYEGVQGAGYLEMWSHFPDGSKYFSRTLAEQGPMMKLQGTSGWRPFALPFDATGAPPPTRLVFNVVIGRGVVYVGPLQLADLGPGDRAGMAARFGGLTGAVAGALVGCVGALVGVLTSLGRARRLAVLSTTALIAFGTIAFVGGVVALALSQPYSVYYPLLLIGFLASVVPLGLLPTIRRRYEEIELRTMRAHDVG